ncbi:hypothetical protein J437_LFUL006474 [Ladona fulva]|uniref:ATP-dependent RNA helicase n=1 Tax=Ladona fulva TaxID=123851 RepID=A0A8K0K3W6_LADFU|nr:hypothetical protein J437_LFUL006474 [Ladona fulva]
MTAFEEMGVIPAVGKAVEEMDWMLPTDVQAEAIPLILGGGDVLMAAETGSGKTGAFCLPVLQIVVETLQDIKQGKGSKIVAQTSPHWTLSFFDRGSALAVTPDGLRCQSREQKEWHGARATKGVHGSGKYYYEAIVTDEGLCRVGWSTALANLDLGTDRFGFGFGGTGKKSNNKQFDNYGESFGMHDVIGCYLDLDRSEIKFSKNGTDLGKAFSIPQNLKDVAFFPAVVLKNAEMSFNFGAQPFKHDPPSGYMAVCQALKENVKSSDVTGVGGSSEKKIVNNAPQAIIIEITSDGRRLQMIVCSATLHDFDVKKMAERLMHFPTWVDLKGEDAVPETVHHVVVMIDPQKDKSWTSLRKHVRTDGVHASDNLRPNNPSAEMLSEAVKMLKGEYCVRAINEHKMDRAIIFCRTKLDCDNLEHYLNQIGGGSRSSTYSCVCLHGDRKPPERKANLEKFKNQEVRFLICTDVAARGIDISGLPFMINITLPDEKSNYVHRIGRVGRAERMGLAISLVAAVPEKVWYHGEWCPTRGRSCHNTRLTTENGCCIWYDEPRYLAEIEDHLNITIQQVGPDIKVPVDSFDGKVVYGQKKLNTGSSYQNHVAQMAPTVEELAKLESKAQLLFLKRHYGNRNR